MSELTSDAPPPHPGPSVMRERGITDARDGRWPNWSSDKNYMVGYRLGERLRPAAWPGMFRGCQRERHREDVASRDAERASPDRLKSRALALGTLVGRWASDGAATLSPATYAEVLSLTAGLGNLLRIELAARVGGSGGAAPDFRTLASATGKLADAAEKLDHLEEYRHLAEAATLDLARWCLAAVGKDPTLSGCQAVA